ncbi:MAG: hypothetical protein KGH99_04825 [Thaumarchaeota archaeon]|nr:hypothetical protein [Candidatus Nitrosotalea sp.]MDE1872787.1 hypothetical protein [Nitrososphaerota archaeon]
MKILSLTIIALTAITIIMGNDFNAYAACAAAGPNGTQICETGIPTSGYTNPGPPPDPLFLTDSKGNIDNFLTNHQILIRADVWPGQDTKAMDVGINMTSDTGFAFYDKKHLIFEPSTNNMQQVIWQFIPTKTGNYTVEKFSNGVHTSSTFFSVFDSKSSSNSPVLVSPLRQFKWGILKETIQCQTDSVLVFKTKDGSPACVKPDTVTKLVTRDWAKVYVSNQFDASSISNFQPIYDDTTNSTKQCEIPLGGKEGYIPVMYMPVNSVGKICVEYSSNYAAKVNLMFYDAIPSQNSSKSITVIAQPSVIPEGKSDVVFTIKTGNQTGFFGAELFCVGMPFAVGYDDQSSITAADFPWMKHSIIHCPAAIYTTKVLGVHGIGTKYVLNSLID